MWVTDVMSTNVRTVDARDTIEHASAVMHDAGVHHLVVLSGGQMIGLVSADRLERGQAEGILRVEDVMRRHVQCAPTDATLAQAAALLRDEPAAALPIVSYGRVVGIVTVSDLLNVIASSGQLASDATRPPATGRKSGARPVLAGDRSR